MQYVISRERLPDSVSEMEQLLFFNLWQSKLWPYRELAQGDDLFWYETTSGTIIWRSRVKTLHKFAYKKKSEVADRLRQDGGDVSADPYFVNAPSSGFCLAYKVSALERVQLPKPDGFRFPQQGWLRVDEETAERWIGKQKEDGKQFAVPALPLQLHARYGRREAFGSVGVTYTQQNRSLNTGLSPQSPDGGFLIFVTLDKEGFDPRHDYDDDIFEKQLLWVTRRGRGETHQDYVKLRQPATRVSLFVRNDADEKFLYAGELRYESHRELTDPTTGEVQQSYTWQLRTPLPEALIRELKGYHDKVDKEASKRPGGTNKSRKPSSFDEYRKALSYALGSLERRLVPGHHNYQVRLKKFLVAKGVTPEFEKDFVDVRFGLKGEKFIGEIKVTGFLGLNQAFRVAFGQVLEYAHLRFKDPPRMVMFLDREPDSRRVMLASKFLISVIVERDSGDFALLNPEVMLSLGSVFTVEASSERQRTDTA